MSFTECFFFRNFVPVHLLIKTWRVLRKHLPGRGLRILLNTQRQLLPRKKNLKTCGRNVRNYQINSVMVLNLQFRFVLISKVTYILIAFIRLLILDATETGGVFYCWFVRVSLLTYSQMSN